MELFSPWDFGDNITKVRSLFDVKVEMLKNRSVAVKLINDFLHHYPHIKLDTSPVDIDEFKALLAHATQENIDEFVNNWVQISLEVGFEINLMIIAVIEGIFANGLMSFHIDKDPKENFQIVNKCVAIFNQRILLGEKISVSANSVQEEPDYDYLFMLTLRQMNIHKVAAFLNYHDEKYKGDFRGFLKLCLMEHGDLLNPLSLELAKDWLADIPQKAPVAANDANIKWTGGANKNQFVQLVYGLHKAKLLNNGEGEVTKIVESLGDLLHVDLNKTWPSNHSNSIHKQNYDYSPPVFDKIKSAYKEHAERLKKSKESKKEKE